LESQDFQASFQGGAQVKPGLPTDLKPGSYRKERNCHSLFFLAASVLSLGRRPASTNEDLPLPDGPMMKQTNDEFPSYFHQFDDRFSRGEEPFRFDSRKRIPGRRKGRFLGVRGRAVVRWLTGARIVSSTRFDVVMAIEELASKIENALDRSDRSFSMLRSRAPSLVLCEKHVTAPQKVLPALRSALRCLSSSLLASLTEASEGKAASLFVGGG
jgi:hypothetical protein